MLLVGTVPVQLYVWCHFTQFFGSYDAPSPKQLREASTRADVMS